MKIKSILLSLFAILLLITFVLLFYRTINEVRTPNVITESFGAVLWNTWGISIVIVAFVIFAGGASILVLLGGAWRWD